MNFTKISLVIASIFVGLLLGEFYLRDSKKYANYWELNNIPKDESFGLPEPWLLIGPRNQKRTITRNEFTQETSFNSEGLPGPELNIKKQPGEFRIIFLGDSSTQGTGDVELGGYVNRLATKMPKSRESIYSLINAGVYGSDPVFEWELLRRQLLKFKPDLVVMAINLTDIYEVKMHGGLDRFDSEGRLKPQARPWWYQIFNSSHLVRMIMISGGGYGWDYLSPDEAKRADERAIGDIVKTAEAIQKLGGENGFRFHIFLHPYSASILRRTSAPKKKLLEKSLVAAGLSVSNLFEDFMSNIPVGRESEYVWSDLHYTPKGYEIFANSIFSELVKHGVLHKPVTQKSIVRNVPLINYRENAPSN